MHIGWPQGIVLALMLIGVGIALSRYGETKTDTYDICNVAGPFIFIALLWWGGFFGG